MTKIAVRAFVLVLALAGLGSTLNSKVLTHSVNNKSGCGPSTPNGCGID